MAANGIARIKDLPQEDRPRERLVKFGRKSLTNSELLAILLRTGNQNAGSALDLARKLLESASDSLYKLSCFSLADFLKVKGIGEAKAITLLAAMELSKRITQETIRQENISFTDPETVYRFLKHDIPQMIVEEFRVLYLNSANQLINMEVVSKGLVNETLIHPREVFRPAIQYNATAVILIHNHPSGEVRPSSQDIHITKKIVEAGKIVGINVLDHLIVAPSGFFSFQEEGLMG